MKRTIAVLAAVLVGFGVGSIAQAHEIKTEGQKIILPSRQASANAAHYVGCATYFMSERYHTTRVWTVHCHDKAQNETRMHILGVSGCMHAVTMYHIHTANGGWSAYEPEGLHDHGQCGFTPATFP